MDTVFEDDLVVSAALRALHRYWNNQLLAGRALHARRAGSQRRQARRRFNALLKSHRHSQGGGGGGGFGAFAAETSVSTARALLGAETETEGETNLPQLLTRTRILLESSTSSSSKEDAAADALHELLLTYLVSHHGRGQDRDAWRAAVRRWNEQAVAADVRLIAALLGVSRAEAGTTFRSCLRAARAVKMSGGGDGTESVGVGVGVGAGLTGLLGADVEKVLARLTVQAECANARKRALLYPTDMNADGFLIRSRVGLLSDLLDRSESEGDALAAVLKAHFERPLSAAPTERDRAQVLTSLQDIGGGGGGEVGAGQEELDVKDYLLRFLDVGDRVIRYADPERLGGEEKKKKKPAVAYANVLLYILSVAELARLRLEEPGVAAVVDPSEVSKRVYVLERMVDVVERGGTAEEIQRVARDCWAVEEAAEELAEAEAVATATVLSRVYGVGVSLLSYLKRLWKNFRAWLRSLGRSSSKKEKTFTEVHEEFQQAAAIAQDLQACVDVADMALDAAESSNSEYEQEQWSGLLAELQAMSKGEISADRKERRDKRLKKAGGDDKDPQQMLFAVSENLRKRNRAIIAKLQDTRTRIEGNLANTEHALQAADEGDTVTISRKTLQALQQQVREHQRADAALRQNEAAAESAIARMKADAGAVLAAVPSEPIVRTIYVDISSNADEFAAVTRERDALSARVAHLEAGAVDVPDLRRQIAAKDKALSDLREQANQQATELNRYIARHAQLDKVVRERDEGARSLQVLNRQYKQLLTTKDHLKRNLIAYSSTVKGEINALKDEASELKRSKRQHAKRIDELAAEVREQQTVIAEKERAIQLKTAALRTQGEKLAHFERLKQKHAALKAEHGKLQTTHDELEQTHAETTKMKQTWEDLAAKRLSELEVAAHAKQVVDGKLAAANAAMVANRDEMTTLKSTIRELQKDVLVANAVAEGRNDYDTLKQKKTNLEGELETARLELDRMTKAKEDVSSVNETNQNVMDAYVVQIRELRGELNTITKELDGEKTLHKNTAAERDRLQTLTQDVQSLAKTHDAKVAELLAAHAEVVETLQTQLKDADANLTEGETALKTCQEANARLTAELDALKPSIRSIREFVSDNWTTLAGMEVIGEVLQAGHTERGVRDAEALDVAQRAVTKLLAERPGLFETIDTTKTALTTANARVDTLTLENQNLGARIKALETSETESADTNELLWRQIEQLKDAQQQLIGDAWVVIDGLRDSHAALKQEATVVINQKDKELTAAKHAQEITQIRQELLDRQAEVAQAGVVAVVEQQQQRLQSENMTLQQFIGYLTNQAKEYAQIINGLSAQITHDREVYTRHLTAVNAELTTVKSTSAVLQTEKFTLEQTNRSLTEENRALAASLAQIRSELLDLIPEKEASVMRHTLKQIRTYVEQNGESGADGVARDLQTMMVRVGISSNNYSSLMAAMDAIEGKLQENARRMGALTQEVTGTLVGRIQALKQEREAALLAATNDGRTNAAAVQRLRDDVAKYTAEIQTLQNGKRELLDKVTALYTDVTGELTPADDTVLGKFDTKLKAFVKEKADLTQALQQERDKLTSLLETLQKAITEPVLSVQDANDIRQHVYELRGQLGSSASDAAELAPDIQALLQRVDPGANVGADPKDCAAALERISIVLKQNPKRVQELENLNHAAATAIVEHVQRLQRQRYNDAGEIRTLRAIQADKDAQIAAAETTVRNVTELKRSLVEQVEVLRAFVIGEHVTGEVTDDNFVKMKNVVEGLRGNIATYKAGIQAIVGKLPNVAASMTTEDLLRAIPAGIDQAVVNQHYMWQNAIARLLGDILPTIQGSDFQPNHHVLMKGTLDDLRDRLSADKRVINEYRRILTDLRSELGKKPQEGAEESFIDLGKEINEHIVAIKRQLENDYKAAETRSNNAHVVTLVAKDAEHAAALSAKDAEHAAALSAKDSEHTIAIRALEAVHREAEELLRQTTKREVLASLTRILDGIKTIKTGDKKTLSDFTTTLKDTIQQLGSHVNAGVTENPASLVERFKKARDAFSKGLIAFVQGKNGGQVAGSWTEELTALMDPVVTEATVEAEIDASIQFLLRLDWVLENNCVVSAETSTGSNGPVKKRCYSELESLLDNGGWTFPTGANQGPGPLTRSQARASGSRGGGQPLTAPRTLAPARPCLRAGPACSFRPDTRLTHPSVFAVHRGGMPRTRPSRAASPCGRTSAAWPCTRRPWPRAACPAPAPCRAPWPSTAS